MITELLSSLVKPVTDLISEVIPDRDKAAEIAFKVSTMAAEHAHSEVLAQLEVNKAEAGSGTLWNAWRPGVGWVCVFAMAVNFIVIPMFGPAIEAYTPIIMAPLDMSQMMPVLLGMLGLGTMRTFEKHKGVAAK